MKQYTKVFNNPYPSGWENLPSERTAIDANSLQQHTNGVAHIEDYLSNNPIPNNLSELNNDANYAKKSDIPSVPTKTSQLTNDSDFAKSSDIPKKVSELENDSGYVKDVNIPTKLSDLENDTGFIRNTTKELANYMLSSDIENNIYTKEQIDILFNNLLNWKIEIVSDLPTSNISSTTVYCVPKSKNIVVNSIDDVEIFNNPVTGNGVISDTMFNNEVLSIEEVPD